MTTARDIITLSLKEAGILGVGQTALAEDINDCLVLLQRMLKQWQTKRWVVPALQDISMPWNGQKSNTIGPGGYFNVNRPNDVKSGYIVQLNTGTTPISLPLSKIFSYEDYIRITVKELNSLPDHFFYDNHFTKGLGNVFVWPLGTSQYEVHLLVPVPLLFPSTIDGGVISTPGTLYTNGAYIAVPLTGGDGVGATANITVAGGVVSIVELLNGGDGYEIGNVLSAASANIGGTGAGFAFTANSVNSSLDSQLLMPDEYEETIYYNLAIRICSMYQVPPNVDTKMLAKATLNTIRTSNTQVPRLKMPSTLRRGKSFSIYNPDGY